MPKTEIRRIKSRRWIAMTTVAATGLGVAHPAAAGPMVSVPGDTAPFDRAAYLLLASESGEGGEGTTTKDADDGEASHSEGGEAGERGGSSATTDVEILAALARTEGFLRLARALHEAGEADRATEHLAHAETLYHDELEAALKSSGAEEFEDDIDDLLAAIRGDAGGKLAEMFVQTLHAVEEASENIGGGEAARLNAIALVLRAAGKEYAESLSDGTVAMSEPYEEGWAFLTAARAMADGLAGSGDPEVRVALKEINAQLDAAAEAFPTMNGPSGEALDPGVIFGAAARAEIAALGVK